MSLNFKPVITIFHCVTAFNNGFTPVVADSDIEIRSVRLPCSSMIKDVYLLRAYEAGADAVVVLTCPEGECKYIDGNVRAMKRVKRLQTMLDEIGLDGRRLALSNIAANDGAAVGEIIRQMLTELQALGPNPAAGN